MEQFQEPLMSFLGSVTFWVWLLTTLALVSAALLFRRSLKPAFETGKLLNPGALLILAIILTILSLRATPTGDEPHYLIATQSLLQDGDFDLRNNYEQMDYLEYYPRSIPDPHVRIVGNHWYPIHGIGLPILAAPFFAAGGRPGVVVMLVLITVAGIRVLWNLVQQAGLDLKAASLAMLAAVFTLPLVSMSGQVFPEVPAFLLVSLSLLAIFAPALTGWNLSALLLTLVLLPWLHPKYIALAGALLLSAALFHPRREALRALAASSGVLIASVAGLAFITKQWYGVALPGAPIMMEQGSAGNGWLRPLTSLFLGEPWVGLTGALFDQQSGLFLASPVYLLAIPGFLLLWRRKRIPVIACMLIFSSVYLPAGAFSVWYAGFSSPARFLTPIVPVLAIGIANVLEAGGQWSRKLFYLLIIPSILLAYLMTTLPNVSRYGDPVSHHNFFIALFEQFTHLDLTLLFPSFRNVESTTWLTTAIYLFAIILICILLLHRNTAQSSIEESRQRNDDHALSEP